MNRGELLVEEVGKNKMGAKFHYGLKILEVKMKNLWFVFIVLWLATGLLAQVNINGSIMTYNRVRLQQDGKITWNENRLNLKFEGNPSEHVHYYANLRFRGFGFPTATSSEELQLREKNRAYPWGMEFREAYVDIYGFLTDNLDVRIGRQRIAWGTADRLNPTDNLNPDDLEDLFNFGAHFGSNAIQANYYLGDYTLTGVFIPVFHPAVLPYGDWAQAFVPQFEVPPGFSMGKVTNRIILPEHKLSQSSSFAFKLAGNWFNTDWSISYYNGRDDLPLVTRQEVQMYSNPPVFSVDMEMQYPRMQVIGADLAGSLGSVGVWAEGALFLPEKMYLTTITPSIQPYPPVIIEKSVALDDQPYFKWVVGGDYTFKSGWYVNVQFLHGFLHERGSAELNDYLLARVEKKFMHDALKIVPFGVAVAVPEWKDISNNYGIAGGPEIDYYPFDALEIALGAYLIEGKGDNIFSRIKDFDEGFLKVTYEF